MENKEKELYRFEYLVLWSQHKDIHKVTWKSPDNKICKQIGHILVGRRNCTNVCNVRRMTGVAIETYHFL
jgi:hypothetical protein